MTTSFIAVFFCDVIAFACLQVAEEEGLITTPGELDAEPYFVDFLRDAPEMAGRCCRVETVLNLAFRTVVNRV